MVTGRKINIFHNLSEIGIQRRLLNLCSETGCIWSVKMPRGSFRRARSRFMAATTFQEIENIVYVHSDDVIPGAFDCKDLSKACLISIIDFRIARISWSVHAKRRNAITYIGNLATSQFIPDVA